ASPPLLRFALIRLAADRHRLLLTNHHLLMDGWSTPVLVRELLTLYGHGGDAAVLPPVTPYRDYLAWLTAQDRDAAGGAWRGGVAGGAGGPRRGDPDGAARSWSRGARAGTDDVLAGSAAQRGAGAAGAQSGGDAQHGDPDCVGHPARPPDRPRRGGVRRHGGG